MSNIEISVKRNDGAWTFQRAISTEQSALEIFESMCVEVRRVLREPAVSEPAASEFEVISSVASTSIDAEHYAVVGYRCMSVESCAITTHHVRRRLR